MGAMLFRLFSAALLTVALLLASAGMYGQSGAAWAHSAPVQASQAADHCKGMETPEDGEKHGSDAGFHCLSICAAIAATDPDALGGQIRPAAPRGELPLATLKGNPPGRDPPPPRVS